MTGAGVRPRAAAILGFWFGLPGEPESGTFRRRWFERSAAFDAAIGERFGPEIDLAARGALDAWAADPRGALALLLLLDQFPRNLFRGSWRAFAADPRARLVAAGAIAAGHDQALVPLERMFVCLPFVHSEALADQDRAVALVEAIAEGPGYDAEVRNGSIRSALRHREIVARFGRFPHRNTALGRPTTPEEALFLAGPDSSF